MALRHGWGWIGVTLLGATVSATCLVLPAAPAPASPPDAYAASDEYMKERGYRVMTDRDKPGSPADFGAIHRVYVTGQGPKVILLHELPGLREADVLLGKELGQDFEVYAPLMFGVAGQDNTGLGNRQACKSELFKCSDRNARHPILEPLLNMTNEICRGSACGVIGMCLTGTFPLWLVQAEGVVALVMAQPTLPFIHIWPFVGLDISAADTEKGMAIAAQRHASLYLTRYRHDFISGHAAFNLLLKRVTPYKDKLAYFEYQEAKGHGHSTLVKEGNPPEDAANQLRAVRAALNATLRPGDKRSPEH